jgi:hypothetical protein
MFKSLFGVLENVVTVVTAPIEIAADVAKEVTKPLADAAKEVTKEVKDLTKPDTW